MVKDKGSQKLKGTAFIEFWSGADAEKAAAASAKAKSAPFSIIYPSPNPSAPKAGTPVRIFH